MRFLGKVAKDKNGYFYSDDLEKIGILNSVISEEMKIQDLSNHDY
ncbi:MAG: hypothetical protein CM15mP22_3910 [Gammaproteobacteria bacterium]|nr:MAG: hypothetical protein CM15mP22_3910 [Gammaproteobacteria bacterium]